MNKFKMPMVVKFDGNTFYTTTYYQPNFNTIFLLDDYYESCIVNLIDLKSIHVYMDLVEHIFNKKRSELSPVIDPDYFWELRK